MLEPSPYIYFVIPAEDVDESFRFCFFEEGVKFMVSESLLVTHPFGINIIPFAPPINHHVFPGFVLEDFSEVGMGFDRGFREMLVLRLEEICELS